jgi:hypothetical protein
MFKNSNIPLLLSNVNFVVFYLIRKHAVRKRQNLDYVTSLTWYTPVTDSFLFTMPPG